MHESRAVASPAQVPLWTLDGMLASSPSMHVASAMRIEGALDVRRLTAAIRSVADRHEVLRAHFISEDGRLYQVVDPGQPIHLERLDLYGLPQADVNRCIAEIVQRPFVLESGPLLRCALLEIDDDAFVLVVVIHHIVTDGWSTPIFFDEVRAFYEAASEGREPDLPPLPLQYAEHAETEWDRLDDDTVRERIEAIRARLAGAPEMLEIPPDHPRPPTAGHAGATCRRMLPDALARRLPVFSEERGITPFGTLLTAFLVLIHRYTGTDDLVIGTPVAGRHQPQLDRLIGLFANIVPIRADLSGRPTGNALLARARTYSQDAITNQDIPFERVVEALAPTRDASRAPVAQIQFVLQNVPEPAFEVPGLETTLIPVASGGSAFDLSLEVTERRDGSLAAALEHRTDLYEEGTITRLLRHYECVLQGLMDAPDTPIDRLPLMDAAEREQIVVTWNQTEAPYASDASIHELIGAHAARTPDALAVRASDGSLSYAAVERRANFLARRLHAVGVAPGDRCGVSLDRSCHLAVALLAVLKAGATAVPIDPATPAIRKAWLLDRTDAPVLLADNAGAEGLGASRAQVVLMDRFAWDDIDTDPGPPDVVVDPLSTAFLMFTSGSTGEPKGVQVHHRGVINTCYGVQRRAPLSSDDRVLQKATIGFDAVLGELFWPWLHGAAVVMVPPGAHRDMSALVRTIREEGITRYLVTPSLLGVMFEDPDFARCDGVRTVISVGEELPLETARRFHTLSNAALANAYGPTETTIFATFAMIEPGTSRILVGSRLDNFQVFVLDPAGAPVPVGVPGEVYIGGVGVTHGYFAEPELTAAAFVASPLEEVSGTLYRTGDLGRLMPDGSLEHLGRLDNQVQLRGIRIEPGEIESVLLQHQAVKACVVTVTDAGDMDARLVAFATTDPDVSVNSDALRAFARERLPETMVPSRVTLVDSLPTTTSGKFDRVALRSRDAGGAESVNGTNGETAAVETIQQVFSDVLGRPEVAPDDDFFRLGGHSLLAIRIATRVADALDAEVSLGAIFDHATPAKLADYLAQAGRSDA